MESGESTQIDKKCFLISLGPYYPWKNFKEIQKKKPNLVYPAFSDILLGSKSGRLHNVPSNFIVKARRQQLRILSNFCANYLKAANIPLNYDRIIPVPAKPMYSFNSIEIICQEFSKIFNIPIDLNIIKRISNTEKYYNIINKSINLSNLSILLIDDIITEGDTKDFVYLRLNEIGCGNICIITLGKTDHNLYE